jgi:hypothetical protein
MMVTVTETKNEPEVYTALLAVARTVAVAHDPKRDRRPICPICASLHVLDRVLPNWRIAVLMPSSPGRA